jgi:diguanylate cyclase (GGDEF)-like protein
MLKEGQTSPETQQEAKKIGLRETIAQRYKPFSKNYWEQSDQELKEKKQEQQILYFDDQEINDARQIPEIVNKYFEDIQLKKTQQDKLKKWFGEQINKFINRKRKGEEQITGKILNEILNNKLGELKALAEQAMLAEQENHDRLNPHLETRPSLQRKFEAMRKELGNVEEGGKKVIVMANIDLDDFKSVNDAAGHIAGDKVLTTFGTALGNSIRPEDYGAHYSGDEFAIMLEMTFDADISEEEIEKEIQKTLARIIEDSQAGTDRSKVKPDTQELSTGFVVVDKDNLEEYDTLQTKADHASETSKILRIMEEDKGNEINSSGRIINYKDYEKIEKQYDKKTVKKAKFIRGAKREAITLFAPEEGKKETPEEIEQRLKNERELVADMKKLIDKKLLAAA